MNAYAHRDWENGGAVTVEIFNDAVEITSPRWFIPGQGPEDHMSGASVSSKSRNELIAQTLFKSGDIESQGTGIRRIKTICDQANIPVRYEQTADGTKLVFCRRDAFGESLVIDEPSYGEKWRETTCRPPHRRDYRTALRWAAVDQRHSRRNRPVSQDCV